MIDSHCHLDQEPLFQDLENVIQRSKDIGIEKILTISTNFKSFENITNIVNKDDIIYGTFGIHPHETKDNLITKEIIREKISLNKKIIGIGETGLDFYYNNSDKKSQIKSFEEHIKASIEMKLPLIIHSRNNSCNRRMSWTSFFFDAIFKFMMLIWTALCIASLRVRTYWSPSSQHQVSGGCARPTMKRPRHEIPGRGGASF
mgnify:CR=1 FL=1